MDKGIRPYCDAKFMELLPQRAELGNTVFRKTVMSDVMTAFSITLASAATHYNHAFIQARVKAQTDATIVALLGDLGRPEGKKGGRKKKVVVEATPAVATTETAPAVETTPEVSPTPEATPEAAPTVEAVAEQPVVETAELTVEEQAAVGEELQQEQATQTAGWPFAADGTNTVTGESPRKRKGKKD